jgi:serine phosphatase RsbU (regulator of sigma subunit)
MADWEKQPSRTIPLERGDILVFLTDGILESWGSDGESFGVEHALEIVREHRHEPSRRILDRLLAEVHRFLMGAIQEDDMTAVICKMGEAR